MPNSNGYDRRAGGSYRWLHLLNLLLLIGLWGFTVGIYNHLPAMIPGHVGFGGVTRWVERGGAWFLPPTLGTFSAFIMYVMSLLASAPPGQGMNVPHRKRLLSLPKEGQLYAMEPLRAFMYGMASWVLLLTLAVQYEFYRIAVEAQTRAPDTGGLLWITLGLTILPLSGLVWLNRAVQRRIEEFEHYGAGEPSPA